MSMSFQSIHQMLTSKSPVVVAGLATRSTEGTVSIDSTTTLPFWLRLPPLVFVAEAEILRGVFGVPRDLLGQGMLGVEVKIAVQAVSEGHFLDQADAVPQAGPWPGTTWSTLTRMPS